MADTSTDTTTNSGLLGSLGTINASGTVSLDSNTIVQIVAGVVFIVVVIIAGIFILRRTKA